MKPGGFSAQLNGIYRAPADAGVLRAAARNAGLRWGVIDLRCVRGKGALLRAIASGLAFPDTFGGNWDALADSLQDLSWLPEPGWVVVLHGAADFAAAAPDDYAALLDILGAAADYWQRRQGRIFIALADVAAGLPEFPGPVNYKIPVSVLVLVHSADLQVLLLERADRPGFWQSVTGSQNPGETLAQTALRELAEETGITTEPAVLIDWNRQHRYEIYPHWRSRYAPGVIHNTEHVFGLTLPVVQDIVLAPREHVAWQWLPWREAADRVFSWTNADAIRELPQRVGRIE